MPIDTSILLEEGDIEVTPALLEAPDVKQLVQFQLLETQNQLLEYNKQSIVAGYYPTLSLAANYSYQGLGEKFPLSNAKPEDGVFWTDYASVGLNLKFLFFAGLPPASKSPRPQNEWQS